MIWRWEGKWEVIYLFEEELERMNISTEDYLEVIIHQTTRKCNTNIDIWWELSQMTCSHEIYGNWYPPPKKKSLTTHYSPIHQATLVWCSAKFSSVPSGIQSSKQTRSLLDLKSWHTFRGSLSEVKPKGQLAVSISGWQVGSVTIPRVPNTRCHKHTDFWQNKWKEKSLSHVRLFAIPWTVCSPPGSSIHGIF